MRGFNRLINGPFLSTTPAERLSSHPGGRRESHFVYLHWLGWCGITALTKLQPSACSFHFFLSFFLSLHTCSFL